ncbi:hypothetical protein ACNKHV_13845 [Shigella flexneri]
MSNGSHSFLAYLGYLSGFAHISDWCGWRISPCRQNINAE